MRALTTGSFRLVLRSSRKPCESIIYSGKAQLSTASPTFKDETVATPVGNNGLVSLRITRSTVPDEDTHSQPKATKHNLILYLPPGPLFHNKAVGSDKAVESQGDVIAYDRNATVPSLQHALASATAATVVTVEYRLGQVGGDNASAKETLLSSQESHSPSNESSPPRKTDSILYQYPTPVHDTLAGFDWIQTHLKPKQLGIFGSHIGGSLALMLALTEAQSVNAVAASVPICDWPGLDDYCTTHDAAMLERTKKRPKKKTSKSVAPPDLVPLLEARKRFFSPFERCFDSFASPILFLRSAGRDVPREFPEYLTGPEYPVPVLKDKKNTTSAEQQVAYGGPFETDAYPTYYEDDVGQNLTKTRRRKAMSRWPPYGLDYGSSGNTWSQPGHGVHRLQVALPWVRIFSQMDGLAAKDGMTGAECTVLSRQSEEMVSAMRRACFFGRENGFAERRVTLSQGNTNLGLDAGKWFNDIFRGLVKEE
ncbi:hypothetical protein N7532_008603 [Penicillium argentinense]|uniref:Alpha/beta hydrolase fold-3 domain-containing protein n=1 Tax=Penicillium argentinense TaxID=1131581 RepID=A0A9W9EXX6_9EURO|nr:uncharacterized protein N7532_008603 [Penicillium argentinense]KAJ5089919.1 hypothetical protein N7532_008603 [Penicillium argentinense]